MLNASRCYLTKAELKRAKGKQLQFAETSMFGPEYNPNGTVTMVGPCAYTSRKWYASIKLVDGKIVRVS